MSRLRIVYTLLLVLLVVLVGFTVFPTMITGEEYSEVSREQLLETPDEWIFEFDIINHESKTHNFIINATVDDRFYTETCLITAKGLFTYVHHIPRSKIGNGEVNFAVYKEGEDNPISQCSYYLK